MRETRSPSMSREDRAEHGMWPGGERDCPLARELDRLSAEQAHPLRLGALARARAHPEPEHRHRRRVRRARRDETAGAGLSVAPLSRLDGIRELDHHAGPPPVMEECLSPFRGWSNLPDDPVPPRP